MDKGTRHEIEKVAWKTLKEARIIEPPVRIEAILEHLDLHRDFYNLEDPTFLRRAWHKIKVGGQQLASIINKIKLAAVWLPDETRILVDSALPSPKQEWASFHDSIHRILEWHRPFFLGDTAQTLDPDYQEQLENEANYGASALMFCGPVFTKEACDTTKEWASVEVLANRYKKSLTTTVRRYVEHSHDYPMAMLVSTAYWDIKPENQSERYRHFIRSKKFIEQFNNVTPEQVLAALDNHVKMQRGGPVADSTFAKASDFVPIHYIGTTPDKTADKCAEKFSHSPMDFLWLGHPLRDGEHTPLRPCGTTQGQAENTELWIL